MAFFSCCFGLFLRACSCFFVCASASAAFFFFFSWVCVCKVCTVKQDVPYIYLIVLRLLRCCNREKTAVMKYTNHISYARLLSLLFFFRIHCFFLFSLLFAFPRPCATVNRWWSTGFFCVVVVRCFFFFFLLSAFMPSPLKFYQPASERLSLVFTVVIIVFPLVKCSGGACSFSFFRFFFFFTSLYTA